jgi:hypothetical protein
VYSTLIWVAAFAVIVILIDWIFESKNKEEDQGSSRRASLRGSKNPFDVLNDQRQTRGSRTVAKPEDQSVTVQPHQTKPMLPPPGEVRIEAVAPRNVGRRK